jgi:iron(III) transport system ATP-binding protein
VSPGTAPAPAVSLRGVSAGYADLAVLRGIDLDVEAGTIVSLLGPSGCGKTTLLRVVAGFLRPSDGTVALSGEVVAGPGTWTPPERRAIGLVPQEGALFPHLDVGRNVAFGLHGMPRRAREARVAECLALVGLEDAGRRRPGELSGGQQQRVALARALAPGPSVVLLDEPFSALDAALRGQVREEVREVLRVAGATALLVTHDQEEALSFSDRVAVMRDGRLAQVADPVTVYGAPADLGVARFVGESVCLEGVVSAAGSTVSCALGELTWVAGRDGAGGARSWEPAPGEVVTVLVRPEQVDLAEAGCGSSGSDATVHSVSYFGHDALVRLDLDRGDQPALARLHHRRIPRVGARVAVSVRGPVSVFPGH